MPSSIKHWLLISAHSPLSTWYTRLFLYFIGLIPAFWLFILGNTGQLGADPIRSFEDNLGYWALRFLIASLFITPLRQLFHINLIRYRRMLGLLAFYYAFIHVATYIILDKRLAGSVILKEITHQPYLMTGACAFILLLFLAITSNNMAIRRLRKKWKQLHSCVYLAAILVGTHFMLAVKSWPTNMLIYNAILVILLGYRAVIGIYDSTKKERKTLFSPPQELP